MLYTMLPRLVTFFSNAPSWCRLNINDPISLLLTSLLLLLFLSLSWMLFIKESKNRQPPLPPGPRGLPLVGNLLSLHPQLHTYLTTLAHTYGPILTLWLGKKITIVVTSQTMAREILKDHDAIFANRDVPAVIVKSPYGGRDVAWSPYGDEWRLLRKIVVNEMLSNTTLDAFYSLRQQEIRRTIGYIHSQAGTRVNIGEQMFLTILNVITNMMWGGVFTNGDRASVAELRQVIGEMTSLMATPNISDFYPGLARFDLQGFDKKMAALMNRLDAIFDGLIDQRSKIIGEGGTSTEDVVKQSKDFLELLLQMKDGGDAKAPLTMIHVKALLLDMVVGGTDTTSSALEFAMAELINKPEVMERVKQELDTTVGKNNRVEESHIPKLPYLYAVMKESLRLHSTLPLLVPHSPSQTCIIGGYTIPKGSRIFINVWAIQRDPSVWKNPSEFNPERFLDGKGDFSGREFEYFPFGSGRRNCAGIAMAKRMFMFVLASIIHAFDWRLPEGENVDLSEEFGIVLKKKIPLVVIPTARLSDQTLYE